MMTGWKRAVARELTYLNDELELMRIRLDRLEAPVTVKLSLATEEVIE